MELRAHSHSAQSMMVPPTHWPSLTLLQSNGTWVTWSNDCHSYFYSHFFILYYYLFNCSLASAIYKTVSDFSTALYPDFAVVCPNLRLHKQSQRCRRSMLVLVHVHSYHPEADLFQAWQGHQRVPCLSMERSAHTSQTNWTLKVKPA